MAAHGGFAGAGRTTSTSQGGGMAAAGMRGGFFSTAG
jgi:hypothetical protein